MSLTKKLLQSTLSTFYCAKSNLTHCYQDVKAPHTRHQVKHTQLTRLIKFGVLALGEMKTPVHFLQ